MNSYRSNVLFLCLAGLIAQLVLYLAAPLVAQGRSERHDCRPADRSA